MTAKIAHEAPISIFNQVRYTTDYDYALVHLFEENERYWDCFKDFKSTRREVILDNSIFELGEAFSTDKFYPWIEKLLPTWYIIPDKLEDAEVTVKNVKEWQHVPLSKAIGVVQGKTYEEMVWCYKEIEPLVDKVAISFDYSFFVDEDKYGKLPTKFHYYMLGRDDLIHRMLSDRVINENKRHHLLGCGLPQEFTSYRNYNWIDSIDTSNPVVAGIKGIEYNGVNGLEDKPTVKLFTLIDAELDDDTVRTIRKNISWFRQIVRG